MSINKRFAHLNHSGSNHSILDAESAYITGTLQVGPAVPALGSDVNFFVSGAKDGEGGAIPAVGVFGGDLVVSGNLHFLGGITGSIPGVEAYWASEAAGEIFTSASLVNVPSGSVHAQFLSSSNGAEITGSVVVDLTQGPTATFIISGSGNNSVPAFDVVNTGLPGNTYSMFKVDPSNFKLIAATPDPSNYIDIDLSQGSPYYGPSLSVVSGVHGISLWPNSDTLQFQILQAYVGPAKLNVYDYAASGLGDLNLQIRALQLNGDAGVAGYALTSSGPGVAPGWAPFPAGASEYWFSSGSNEIATTGSVALVGADYPTKDKASDYGSDVFFFVSGAVGYNSNDKSVFGGNVFVSGNIIMPHGQLGQNSGKLTARNFAGTDYAELVQLVDLSVITSGALGTDVVLFGDGSRTTGFAFIDSGAAIALITGSNQGYFSGSYTFPQGITGSITKVPDGSDYLLAGTGITLTTQSNGAITIDAVPSSSPQWYYSNVDEIATSGSVAITGSLAVTGAAYFSPAGTGRGLLKFGGLDIGPITGSASTSTDAVLGGNILSASFGVWNGTDAAVLRHEFHILGIGTDGGSGLQTFAATYLVMSVVNSAGAQTALSVTELSRETSGSFAAAWDVNVANDCSVEVTSSIDAGSVEWYAQRVKEMSVNVSGSRS